MKCISRTFYFDN